MAHVAGHGGAHETGSHHAPAEDGHGGGSGGGFAELGEILSVKGLAGGLGQELGGTPVTNILQKDLAETTATKMLIAGTGLGSQPVGEGGGGHHE